MSVLCPENSVRIITIHEMKTVVEAARETLHMTKLPATMKHVRI